MARRSLACVSSSPTTCSGLLSASKTSFCLGFMPSRNWLPFWGHLQDFFHPLVGWLVEQFFGLHAGIHPVFAALGFAVVGGGPIGRSCRCSRRTCWVRRSVGVVYWKSRVVARWICLGLRSCWRHRCRGCIPCFLFAFFFFADAINLGLIDSSLYRVGWHRLLAFHHGANHL